MDPTGIWDYLIWFPRASPLFLSVPIAAAVYICVVGGNTSHVMMYCSRLFAFLLCYPWLKIFEILCIYVYTYGMYMFAFCFLIISSAIALIHTTYCTQTNHSSKNMLFFLWVFSFQDLRFPSKKSQEISLHKHLVSWEVKLSPPKLPPQEIRPY